MSLNKRLLALTLSAACSVSFVAPIAPAQAATVKDKSCAVELSADETAVAFSIFQAIRALQRESFRLATPESKKALALIDTTVAGLKLSDEEKLDSHLIFNKLSPQQIKQLKEAISASKDSIQASMPALTKNDDGDKEVSHEVDDFEVESHIKFSKTVIDQQRKVSKQEDILNLNLDELRKFPHSETAASIEAFSEVRAELKKHKRQDLLKLLDKAQDLAQLYDDVTIHGENAVRTAAKDFQCTDNEAADGRVINVEVFTPESKARIAALDQMVASVLAGKGVGNSDFGRPAGFVPEQPHAPVVSDEDDEDRPVIDLPGTTIPGDIPLPVGPVPGVIPGNGGAGTVGDSDEPPRDSELPGDTAAPKPGLITSTTTSKAPAPSSTAKPAEPSKQPAPSKPAKPAEGAVATSTSKTPDKPVASKPSESKLPAKPSASKPAPAKSTSSQASKTSKPSASKPSVSKPSALKSSEPKSSEPKTSSSSASKTSEPKQTDQTNPKKKPGKNNKGSSEGSGVFGLIAALVALAGVIFGAVSVFAPHLLPKP